MAAALAAAHRHPPDDVDDHGKDEEAERDIAEGRHGADLARQPDGEGGEREAEGQHRQDCQRGAEGGVPDRPRDRGLDLMPGQARAEFGSLQDSGELHGG